MKSTDGRRNSHRKGSEIGHSKVHRRAKAAPRISMEQLRKDIDRGYKYFWSRPHRCGLTGGAL